MEMLSLRFYHFARRLLHLLIMSSINCYGFYCEQIAENRRQIRYTPNIEVIIPGRTNIVFDGTVVYTKGSQAEINVALRNAFRDPVTLQGMSLILFKRPI